MQENRKTVRFFLSANTPQGFISKYDRLYSADDGWKAIVLTGGPGTGKSEMLKKLGSAFESAGIFVEYIPSCSDCKTLDAISVPSMHVCMIDGALPHGLNPEYPGIVETMVDLGNYWDETQLARCRGNVLMFSSRMNSSSDRAYRFLAAAASLISDTYRLALECTDSLKLENYAAHLAKRGFPNLGKQGVETQRFLTAITPDGIADLFGTVTENYSKVFVIEDDYGIGKIFLNKLRSAALSSGYDVISCCCPMFPDGKPEHLLIPSLSTAFVTSSHYHRFDQPGYRHIHIRRFLDKDLIRLKRPRISFNRRASRQLIDEAILLLSDARANYDMIKSCYTDAMDYEKVNGLTDALIEKLVPLPLQ